MGSNVAEPNTTELCKDSRAQVASKALFGILAAISFCHLLNDMVQSLIPAIYPILKSNFNLDFGQIGLISLTYQLVACLLQPFVGLYTDKRPKPYSLAVGMGLTLIGLLMLATANTFGVLLIASAFVGMGSSIFHPESSRVARLASGGQHGLAQSVFQVGGNAGSALGPLLAAYLVVPHGQRSIAWCSIATVGGMMILARIGSWYKRSVHLRAHQRHIAFQRPALSSRKVAFSIAVLIALIFSKYFYLASLTSYYTFYLISKFHVSVRSAQLLLFLFLGAAAVGTVVGGPVGDRFGRKLVIWCSIIGVLPFTLILPYVNLFWTAALTVIIGLVIASAFTAILVYAQELMPGKVGMVSGLFFGFAFGMGGVGAAVLGKVADATSITFVYHVCAFLPAIGILTMFLPDMEKKKPPMAVE
ncbi:MAG TPA: MFS transporter [Bryobacteraceae bacterium]|jgi:FSR family fosmidomycin resistance protein-like MFS transporter|nr:MFS transporter [Bryobacteraceae bacterium]